MTMENSAAVSAIETDFAAEVSQLRSEEAAQSGTRSARSGRTRMSMNAPVTAGAGKQASETETRGVLKTLLDRTPAPVARDESGQAPSLATMFGAPADATETAQETDPTVPAGPEAIPAGASLASLVAQAGTSVTET